MALFGIQFFNHAGTIYAEHTLAARDETEAARLAPERFASGIGKGFRVMSEGKAVLTFVHGEGVTDVDEKSAA